MKKVFWNIVLPLTFISFTAVTQWWEYSVDGGPKEVLWGFPFPMSRPNYHSGLDIFLMSGILNFTVYLLICTALVFGIYKWKGSLSIPAPFNHGFKFIAGLHLCTTIIFASNPGNQIHWEQNVDLTVFQKGIVAYGYPFALTGDIPQLSVLPDKSSSPKYIHARVDDVVKKKKSEKTIPENN
ncbi:MAG: hypothetical protein SchgKO_16620 [Schleiferiaceae bacterium]